MNPTATATPPFVRRIGALTDGGGGERGASMGPEALRGRGAEVIDAGNLDGFRHLPEVAAWCSAVHEAVLAALRAGQLPPLLGSDHKPGHRLTRANNAWCTPPASRCSTCASSTEQDMRAAMERALADMEAPTHLRLSLDADFLGSEIAPGVATTVRDGPTYREAQLCMEMVADTGRLASLDIVEIHPAFDTHSKAADLVDRLFGKRALMRRRAQT